MPDPCTMSQRVPRDPHLVLGVERGATRMEIQRAFRARAREVHPDVSGEDTTDAMAALSAARDDLLRHAPAERRTATGSRVPPDTGRRFDGEWDDYWSSWWSPRKKGT
jgi:hypothetical protein